MNQVGEHGLDSLGNDYVKTCSNVNDYHMVVQRTKRADEQLSYHDIGLFREWVNKPFHIQSTQAFDTSKDYLHFYIATSSLTTGTNLQTLPKYGSLEFNTWTVTEEGYIVLWCHRDKCIQSTVSSSSTNNVQLGDTKTQSATINQTFRFNNKFEIAFQLYSHAEWCINLTSNTAGVTTLCSRPNKYTSDRLMDQRTWTLILEPGFIHPYCNTLNPIYVGATYNITDQFNNSGDYTYDVKGYHSNTSTGYTVADFSTMTVSWKTSITDAEKEFARWGMGIDGKMFLLEYPEYCIGKDNTLVKHNDSNAKIYTYYNKSYTTYKRTPLSTNYCIYQDPVTTPDDIKEEVIAMQRPLEYTYNTDDNVCLALVRKSDGKYAECDPTMITSGNSVFIDSLTFVSTATALCRLELWNNRLCPYGDHDYLIGCTQTTTLKMYNTLNMIQDLDYVQHGFEMITTFLNFNGIYELRLIDKNTYEPSHEPLKIPKLVQGDKIYDKQLMKQEDKNLLRVLAYQKYNSLITLKHGDTTLFNIYATLIDNSNFALMFRINGYICKYDVTTDSLIGVNVDSYDANDDSFQWILYTDGQLRNKYNMKKYMHYDNGTWSMLYNKDSVGFKLSINIKGFEITNNITTVPTPRLISDSYSANKDVLKRGIYDTNTNRAYKITTVLDGAIQCTDNATIIDGSNAIKDYVQTNTQALPIKYETKHVIIPVTYINNGHFTHLTYFRGQWLGQFHSGYIRFMNLDHYVQSESSSQMNDTTNLLGSGCSYVSDDASTILIWVTAGKKYRTYKAINTFTADSVTNWTENSVIDTSSYNSGDAFDIACNKDYAIMIEVNGNRIRKVISGGAFPHASSITGLYHSKICYMTNTKYFFIIAVNTNTNKVVVQVIDSDVDTNTGTMYEICNVPSDIASDIQKYLNIACTHSVMNMNINGEMYKGNGYKQTVCTTIYNMIYTSYDYGVTWTLSFTAPDDILLTGIEYGDGAFLVGTNTNKIYYSLDCINWFESSYDTTANDTDIGTIDKTRVVYGNGEFILCVKNTSNSWYNYNVLRSALDKASTPSTLMNYNRKYFDLLKYQQSVPTYFVKTGTDMGNVTNDVYILGYSAYYNYFLFADMTSNHKLIYTQDFKTFNTIYLGILVTFMCPYDKYIILYSNMTSFIEQCVYISDTNALTFTKYPLDINPNIICIQDGILYMLIYDNNPRLRYCSFDEFIKSTHTWKEYDLNNRYTFMSVHNHEIMLSSNDSTTLVISTMYSANYKSITTDSNSKRLTHDDKGFINITSANIEIYEYDSMLHQNYKCTKIPNTNDLKEMFYANGVYMGFTSDNQHLMFSHDLFNWVEIPEIYKYDSTSDNYLRQMLYYDHSNDNFMIHEGPTTRGTKIIPTSSLQLSRHYIDACYDPDGNKYTISTNAMFCNDELMIDFCYNLRHVKYDNGFVLAYGSSNRIYMYPEATYTTVTFTTITGAISTTVTKKKYTVITKSLGTDVAEVVNVLQQVNQSGNAEILIACNTYDGRSFIKAYTGNMTTALYNIDLRINDRISMTYNTCSNYVFTPNVRNCYALMDSTLQSPACRVNGRFYNVSKWDTHPNYNTIQSQSYYDIAEINSNIDAGTTLSYGAATVKLFVGNDTWAWDYGSTVIGFNQIYTNVLHNTCLTKTKRNDRSDSYKAQYALSIGGNAIIPERASAANSEGAETLSKTLDPKITLLDLCYNNKMFYVCGTYKTLLIGSSTGMLKPFSFKELDQCSEDTAILHVKVVDSTHVCIVCSNGYVTKFNPNFKYICNSHDDTDNKKMNMPANRKIIVAMNSESLWASNDGGRTWKRTFQVSTSITFTSIHYYPSYYGDTYFAVTNSNLILYSYDEGYTWHQLPVIPNAVIVCGIVSEYLDDYRITVCYSDNTENVHPRIGHCVWIKPWESNTWTEYEYNGLTICKPAWQPDWNLYSCLSYSKYDGSIALCCIMATESSYPSDSKTYRVWLKGKGKNVFKPILNYNSHSTCGALSYWNGSEPHWNFGGYDNVWYSNAIDYDADSYLSYVHDDRLSAFNCSIMKMVYNQRYGTLYYITSADTILRYRNADGTARKLWTSYPGGVMNDIIIYNNIAILVGNNRSIYVHTRLGYSSGSDSDNYLNNYRTYTSPHIKALYANDGFKQITHNGYDFLLLTDYGETINEDILSVSQIGSSAPAQVADTGDIYITMLSKDKQSLFTQFDSDAVIDMLRSVSTTRTITKFITRFNSNLPSIPVLLCTDGYSIAVTKPNYYNLDLNETEPYTGGNGYTYPIDGTYYRATPDSYMIIAKANSTAITANNALPCEASYYRTASSGKGHGAFMDGVTEAYRVNAKWCSNVTLTDDGMDYLCVATFARNSDAYNSASTPIAAYQHGASSRIQILSQDDVVASGPAVFARIEGNTYDKNIFLVPFTGGFVWHNETDNLTEFIKPNEFVGITLTYGIYLTRNDGTFLFATDSNYVAYIKFNDIYDSTSYTASVASLPDRVVTCKQCNGQEFILTTKRLYYLSVTSVGPSYNILMSTAFNSYSEECMPSNIEFTDATNGNVHHIALDSNQTWHDMYNTNISTMLLPITQFTSYNASYTLNTSSSYVNYRAGVTYITGSTNTMRLGYLAGAATTTSYIILDNAAFNESYGSLYGATNKEIVIICKGDNNLHGTPKNDVYLEIGSNVFTITFVMEPGSTLTSNFKFSRNDTVNVITSKTTNIIYNHKAGVYMDIETFKNEHDGFRFTIYG